MSEHPCHSENLVALKRIEGQIRGIQKMIEEKRYCVDILHQLHSVTNAVVSVKKKIYRKHLETCVSDAIKEKSKAAVQKKIDEIIDLLSQCRGG